MAWDDDHEYTGAPVITAQWGGRCSACGESYDEGDEITIVDHDRGKWGHVDCA